MSKTEWKEFYRVNSLDASGSYTWVDTTNYTSYDMAIDFGKKHYQHFEVRKYFKQVEVEIIYEYRVVFKQYLSDKYLVSEFYYLSKENFLEETSMSNHFVELVQATKRERK